MALEKPGKENMLAGTTARQKGIIGAMIIIVLIVIWQVVGLMGGGGNAPVPPPKAVVNQGAARTPGTPVGVNAAAPMVNNPQTQQNEIRQAQIASDAKFLQLQQMSEQKYIGKLNDLEDLKIQREIAETNQAIAAAKLATVTAEKDISDLLTKPAAPEIPEAAYANKLVNLTPQGEAVSAPSAQPPAPTSAPAPVIPQVEYTVISVSMQLRKWSAVIGYQGKLYNVAIGDVLAADGSEVVGINKNGVILKKEGKTRKVSITSAI